jgi:hypothetical protein
MASMGISMFKLMLGIMEDASNNIARSGALNLCIIQTPEGPPKEIWEQFLHFQRRKIPTPRRVEEYKIAQRSNQL